MKGLGRCFRKARGSRRFILSLRTVSAGTLIFIFRKGSRFDRLRDREKNHLFRSLIPPR